MVRQLIIDVLKLAQCAMHEVVGLTEVTIDKEKLADQRSVGLSISPAIVNSLSLEFCWRGVGVGLRDVCFSVEELFGWLRPALADLIVFRILFILILVVTI